MLENVGIERAIIASICQNGLDAIVDIEDIGVTSTSFTSIENQALFSCVKHILNNKEIIDQALLLITIKELSYSALFESRKQIEYIGSLFNFPIKSANIRNFAIRLEKLKIAKTAIIKHQEAIEALQQVSGTEDIDTIIQMSENPIFDLITELNQSKDNKPRLLFEDLDEIVDFLIENKSQTIGVPTPWPEYNAAIGSGLRRGGVNLFSSRPKMGKTTLAKEAILHFTNVLKIPCLFLDTEMVRQDQIIRVLASTSKIPIYTVESGTFDDNYLYKQNMKEAVKKLKENMLFWHFSVAGKPFDEILSIMRRWIVKEVGYNDDGNINSCVVVFDYFKIMSETHLGNLQEYQTIGFQLSKLTDFCKEFDFPCVSFVQLNRQNDISQSDRLRWFCHSYSKFERKEDTEIADDGPEGGNRKLTVLDTRFGPGVDDGDYICMNFQRSINKITEVGLRSKLQTTNTDEFETNV